MNQLDIVRQPTRASFVGYFETPQFLAEMTDAVVSHQWENALNYFLPGSLLARAYPLDPQRPPVAATWGTTTRQRGRACRLRASSCTRLQIHDSQWEAYRERQRALIGRYLPSDPTVVATLRGPAAASDWSARPHERTPSHRASRSAFKQ